MNRKRLLLAAAFGLAAGLPAKALELQAVADVSIRINAPGLNYGPSPSLEVNPNTVTYVRFAVPPTTVLGVSGSVHYAELRLYVNRVFTPGTVSVYRLRNSTVWDENTVSAPIANAILPVNQGDRSVSVAGVYLAFDITSLADASIRSQIPVQIGIVTTDANILLDSRENIATSHGPGVEVVFANTGPKGDTGAPGGTGAQGPQGGTGPAGVDGVVRISSWQSATQTLVVAAQTILNVACPANFPRILSGGCDTQGGTKMRMHTMGPVLNTGNPDQWACTFLNDSSQTRTAVSWARCTVD